MISAPGPEAPGPGAAAGIGPDIKITMRNVAGIGYRAALLYLPCLAHVDDADICLKP
jgi:hypothetical protein